MTTQVTPLNRQVVEKIVRVGVAILGLLVLRGIVSIMPMLRSEAVYVVSLPGLSPEGQQNPLTPEQIQQVLSAAQVQGYVEEIQRAQRASMNILSRSLVDNRAYALQVQNAILMNTGLALFPVTIAKAVIDTLIFGLVFLFGRRLTDLFRTEYARLPDLGLMLNLSIVTTVVGIAYYAYQGLAFPFLFPDNGALYGWVFLVLILAPLVALAVVVARNLDAITALVMNSGSAFVGASAAVAALRCASCGQSVAFGTRFCPHCGAAASSASTAPAAARTCPACRAENPATARFCKECGKPT